MKIVVVLAWYDTIISYCLSLNGVDLQIGVLWAFVIGTQVIGALATFYKTQWSVKFICLGFFPMFCRYPSYKQTNRNAKRAFFLLRCTFLEKATN